MPIHVYISINSYQFLSSFFPLETYSFGETNLFLLLTTIEADLEIGDLLVLFEIGLA